MSESWSAATENVAKSCFLSCACQERRNPNPLPSSPPTTEGDGVEPQDHLHGARGQNPKSAFTEPKTYVMERQDLLRGYEDRSPSNQDLRTLTYKHPIRYPILLNAKYIMCAF